MSDIFVSYSNEDRSRVALLVARLEQHGWSIFWDRRIPAGMTWQAVLEQELTQARCVLVAWSPRSVRSDWVLEEAEAARTLSTFVPVVLEPAEIPMGFKRIQAGSLESWNGKDDHEGLTNLIIDIRRRIGAPIPSPGHHGTRPDQSPMSERPPSPAQEPTQQRSDADQLGEGKGSRSATEAEAGPTQRDALKSHAPSPAQVPDSDGGGGFLQRMLATNRKKSLTSALLNFDRNLQARDTTYRDSLFQAVDAVVGTDTDVVVTGHTGIARCIARKHGGYYFNAGTWASRLLALPQVRPEDLPLLRNEPTVVTLSAQSGELRATLGWVRSDNLGSVEESQIRVALTGPRAKRGPRSLDFTTVHVLSDLYLSGPDAVPVFQQGSLLAAWIDQVRGGPGRRAIVLNGNTFDFRRQVPVTCFDPIAAVAKLQGTFRDPIFAALRNFLLTPDCTLVIVVGDRELECAVPAVRSWLTDALSGPDPCARGRLLIVSDGTGFRCSVGGYSIFCLHGHEFDPWNVFDHGRLVEAARAANFEGDARPWAPSAAARLEIELLDGLIPRYPFLKFLLPVTQQIVPIIAALEPASLGLLSKLARQEAESLRRRDDIL